MHAVHVASGVPPFKQTSAHGAVVVVVGAGVVVVAAIVVVVVGARVVVSGAAALKMKHKLGALLLSFQVEIYMFIRILFTIFTF